MDEIESFVLGDQSPLVALVQRNEELRKAMRRNERKICRMARRQSEAMDEVRG